MKILSFVKEQYGVCNGNENTRGCGQPMWQNLPLIAFNMQNKMYKTTMILTSRNMQKSVLEINGQS